MILRCSIEMPNISYAWKELKEQLSEDIDSKVKGMVFLKGKQVRNVGASVCLAWFSSLMWMIKPRMEASPCSVGMRHLSALCIVFPGNVTHDLQLLLSPWQLPHLDLCPELCMQYRTWISDCFPDNFYPDGVIKQLKIIQNWIQNL